MAHPKPQLHDLLEKKGFSRQTLSEMKQFCSTWLRSPAPGPRGLHDSVIVYVLRDFLESVNNYMTGQETKHSGITSVEHQRIQAAVLPHIRALIGTLGTDNSELILKAMAGFVEGFEKLKCQKAP
jgi:hypothetical protein